MKQNKPTNIWTLIVGFILITIGVPVFASYIVPPNGVSTLTIQTGAVTQAKLAPRPTVWPSPFPSVWPSPSGIPTGGIAISLPGSLSSTTGGVIPNNTITLVTTGRPIVVGLMCLGSTECGIFANSGSIGDLEILRGATVATRQTFQNFMPASSFFFIDVEPAGTYTYSASIIVSISSGSPSFGADNTVMFAYEM